MTDPLEDDRPPEKITLAFSVASRIQIDSVRIFETHAHARLENGKLPSHLELHRTAITTQDDAAKQIVVQVAFRFGANYVQDFAPVERSSLFISAGYRATYTIKKPGKATDEQLDAFGELNAVYNLWPYWREYVQSVLCRMGLPPFAIPVLPPSKPTPQKHLAGTSKSKPSHKGIEAKAPPTKKSKPTTRAVKK
ncbi:MAG: hypothetical protein SH850_11715 [Planctomycetaceae bacterium]|nr:hypothetical protein [Planctomycetaceae bacterium]